MARFARILAVLEELAIPSGVGLKLAEYADLTDEERVILMMDMHCGEVKINDSKMRHLMLYRSKTTNSISICDDFYGSDESVFAPIGIAHMLRKRFWIPKTALVKRSNWKTIKSEWAAPLWSKIYDLWIAI